MFSKARTGQYPSIAYLGVIGARSQGLRPAPRPARPAVRAHRRPRGRAAAATGASCAVPSRRSLSSSASSSEANSNCRASPRLPSAVVGFRAPWRRPAPRPRADAPPRRRGRRSRSGGAPISTSMLAISSGSFPSEQAVDLRDRALDLAAQRLVRAVAARSAWRRRRPRAGGAVAALSIRASARSIRLKCQSGALVGTWRRHSMTGPRGKRFGKARGG